MDLEINSRRFYFPKAFMQNTVFELFLGFWSCKYVFILRLEIIKSHPIQNFDFNVMNASNVYHH